MNLFQFNKMLLSATRAKKDQNRKIAYAGEILSELENKGKAPVGRYSNWTGSLEMTEKRTGPWDNHQCMEAATDRKGISGNGQERFWISTIYPMGYNSIILSSDRIMFQVTTIQQFDFVLCAFKLHSCCYWWPFNWISIRRACLFLRISNWISVEILCRTKFVLELKL